MKYKVHYAKLGLDSDIPTYEFNDKYERLKFIWDNTMGRKKECVWLVTTDREAEVYVTDKCVRVWNYVEFMPLLYDSEELFLFEFDSYQEAYKVALHMAEVSPMCYSPDYNPNTV